MILPQNVLRYCIAFLLLTSCSRPLTQEEFRFWIQDPNNGFRVIKNVNSLIFDVQFKPTRYILTDGNKTGISGYQDDANTVKHITLKIGHESGDDFLTHTASSYTETQQNLYYYSFLFQNDIYLEGNDKKIPCVLYHFEKSLDSKNQRTFHLVFDGPEITDEDFLLVINSDRVSSLPVRFKIRNNDIPQVAGL